MCSLCSNRSMISDERLCCTNCLFFFKQKTAYELRISDWSSDVCSSDLRARLSIEAGGTHAALVSDANPLPLEDGMATRVICTEVLQHVDDPQQDRKSVV